MSDGGNTTLLRRHIGRWLQELRVEAGYSQRAAAEALERSSATLYRIEAGDPGVRFRKTEITAMCDLYQVSQEVRDRLMGLTSEVRNGSRSWWHDYTETELPPWFGLYVSLETAAARIRQYEPETVPGLLQTKAYAHDVTGAPSGMRSVDEVDRLVRIRIERQSLLTQPRSPHLEVILNEGVLHRQVGGPTVMREQLAHLLDFVRRNGVSLRVLPFTAGGHGGMNSAFSILDFPIGQVRSEPVEPTLAYVDTLTGAAYLQKPNEVMAYEQAWADLGQRALDVSTSRTMINKVMEAME